MMICLCEMSSLKSVKLQKKKKCEKRSDFFFNEKCQSMKVRILCLF